MSLVKKLKRKINKSEIISFDIFDTLLLRPYLYPNDVFETIALEYKSPEFYESRIIAEPAAIEKLISDSKDDVTLDEIYENMPKSLRKFKNIESEYEESYTPCEDYQLWARLIDVTCFYNIQEVLVKYRWFQQNTSNRLQTNMSDVGKMIQWQIADKHPLLHQAYIKYLHKGTIFKMRLFGFIPLLKIKNNKVYLFEFIPVFKMRWK